jgi:transposase-like protein
LKKPEQCELCQQTQCLNWHGFYRRQVITLTGIEYIPIRRVLCKECGKTFAVLPGFILKRRRYGIDVIRFALEGAERTTCEKAAGKLAHTYGLIIDTLTIWLWKKNIPKLFLQAAPQM